MANHSNADFLFALKFYLTMVTLFYNFTGEAKTVAGRYDSLGVTLHGNVLDAATKLPLAGATIYLKDYRAKGDLPKGTSTDSAGYFRFTKLRADYYQINISHIGYKNSALDSIDLRSSRKNLVISLFPEPVMLNAVEITASSYAIGADQTSLRGVDMEHQPNPIDDAFRSLHALPGIVADGYNGAFYVRGGLQNELLVQLDGHRLDRPFHFEQFPFGPVNSFISYRWIENMELSLGGFGSTYGDKMSGFLKLASKKPEMKKNSLLSNYHVSGNVGADLLTTQIMLQGQHNLGSAGQLNWLFTGRKGYLDVVLGLTDSDFAYDVSYYDSFLKLEWQKNATNSITWFSLMGSDNLVERPRRELFVQPPEGSGLPVPVEPIYRPAQIIKYGSYYHWLKWDAILSPRIALKQIISCDRHPHSYRVNKSDEQLSLNRQARLAGANGAIDIEWSEKNVASLGWEFTTYNANGHGEATRYLFPQYFDLEINGSQVTANPDDTTRQLSAMSKFQQRGNRWALFLSDRLQILPTVAAELGLRWDYAGVTEQTRVNPRLALFWQINDKLSWRLSGGWYDQSLDLTDFTFAEGEQQLYLSRSPLRVERAKHYITSLNYGWNHALALRFEAYLKNYTELSTQSFISDNALFETIWGTPQKGKAGGLEIFARYRSGSGNWSGWLGYSYAHTKVYVPEVKFWVSDRIFHLPGGWFYRHFDQRHTFTSVLDYSWSKEWQVGLQLITHSGRPFTGATVDEKFETRVAGTEVIPRVKVHIDEIQNRRYPAHIQLDAKFRRRFHFSNWSLDFFIGMLNLLNRPNFDRVEASIQINQVTQTISLTEYQSPGIALTPFVGVYITF